MTLIRRLRRLIDQQRLIDHQYELLCLAGRKLVEQEEAIAERLATVELEHYREVQGIVCAWLINLERPEMDVREDLVSLESNLGLQIAKLEEHIL